MCRLSVLYVGCAVCVASVLYIYAVLGVSVVFVGVRVCVSYICGASLVGGVFLSST